MRHRTIFYLVGLTLLSIFLLTVSWEFAFEDIIGHLFWSDFEEESLQTHWKFVITGTSLAGIALIIPTLVSLRSVTGRKRAEEALRASEERFRAVVDHSPGAIVIKDMEGRNLIANKLFCTWYGTTSEKIIGKSVYDFLEKKIADRITAQEQMVMETGTVFEEERQVTYPDGVTRSVFTQKYPIFGPDGDCLAVGNVITDLTERKKVEELLKIAVDSIPEGFAYFDPDDRLAMVNSKIVDTYPMIPDLLVPGVSYETIVRTGVERGQFCPDNGQDKEEWIEKRLAYHRDPKGAVEFNLPDGRCIRVEEVRTPEGGIVGMRTDITDLKKIERQLREARDELEIRVEERTKELMQSEAWLKAVIKCSPGAVVIRNLEGHNLIVNEIFGDWYAVDRDEIIGKTMVDYLPHKMFKEIAAQEQEVVETKQIVQAERRVTFPDGVTRDIISQKSPIFGPDGDCVAIGTVITDITERVQAEEARRVSEQNYRALFENAAAGIGRSRITDGKVLLANRKLAQIFGYERVEQFVAEFSFVDHYVDPGQRERLIALYKKGSDDTVEVSFTTRDGSVVAVAHQGWVDEKAGHIDFIMTDITERKRAEETLRESEERLRDAIESISEGFVLFDAEERLVLCNSKYREFYPMIADVLTPGRHLEDIVRAAAERGQIIQAIDNVDGWIRERLIQYRSARGTQEQHLSDGRWLVASERRTREGGVVGICTDFTERERAEEALRESEGRLRAIVDSIVVGVITIDEMGVVQSFNPGAERIFGYGPDEVVGESITVLMPEPHRSGHDGYVASYLRTGEANIIGKGREVEGRRKDGSIFPMELEIGEMVVDGRQMFTGIVKDITERKRAEAALRASEERFRQIYENTPVMLQSIDKDGRLLSVSDYWLETLGYEREEVLGRKVYEFYSEKSRRYAKEETLPEFFRTGFAKDVSYQAVKKNGEVMDVLLTATTMRDEQGTFVRSLAVMIDITERKRAEEALRESEERFRTIAENVPGNVYRRILHADGRVTWAYLSPGLRDLMELDPDAVIARPELLTRTLHPEDRAMWEETVQKSVETLEPYVLEYRRITPSGKVKWMRTMARPHRRENGAVVWDGVTLDITEEKKAQAQLIQASKLATLGEMASGIAHELNQPLSVVGMAAELSLMSMEEGQFDIEFVRRKLEKIVGQRDRMAEIIDHMRLFSRTDNVTLESFNPVDAVAGGIHLIEQQFRAAGIKLETDCPADCRNVSGYPLQLEQVVLNLLTNARDAVLAMMDPAGSGNGNPAPRVRVSVVDDKRRKTVVISVADNGGGIPEAALERIFDPFFTTKTEGHGTGLGLSISYSIIDAMGGRLEAQDTEGGAVFHISLPVPANGAGAVNRGKGKNQTTRTKQPRARLPRILVVDDEEVIVEEVAEYLGRKGYDVATAGNGREALDIHQACPADVVVTDLFMPEMSGAELIRRLHKSDPDLPIVVVTGQTTFGDDRDVVAEGASVVLKKPIILRELTDSLKGLGRR